MHAVFSVKLNESCILDYTLEAADIITMWQWHYPSQFSWVDGASDSAASLCSTLDHHGDLLGGPSCASGVYRQHSSAVYSNNVQYAAGSGTTAAALPASASSMMAVTAAGYEQPYISDCGAGLPTSATAMAAVSYYGMYGGMSSTSRCASPGQLDGPWSTYTV